MGMHKGDKHLYSKESERKFEKEYGKRRGHRIFGATVGKVRREREEKGIRGSDKAGTGSEWGALKKAWRGLRISKAEGDLKGERKYEGAINSLQEKLRLKKTKFK